MKQLASQYFNIVQRLMPKHAVRSSVGVDISKNTCKMVELEKHGNSYKLINWSIEPIVHGDLKQAIRTILKKLSRPTHSVKTAVFGKGTLIRYIDMPRMSVEDLKKSLTIEADKYFPFPPDQIYTDCYVLEQREKENKISALIAAAKKEVINERINLLTELGLQADFISINSIAIANVLNVLGVHAESGKPAGHRPSESKVSAILDIGEMVSNVTILVDGLPRFTRDIFIGGYEFTRTISNTMGVSLEEAEQLKFEPGGRKDDMLNSMEAIISNLVSELRLSFDYFANERNLLVNHLLLSGGASLLEGLADIIGKNLETTVESWNPMKLLSLASPISEQEVHQNAGKLGVALGLALYS